MTAGCQLGGNSHDAQAQIVAYVRPSDPLRCRSTWDRERPIIDTPVNRHKALPSSPSAPSVVQHGLTSACSADGAGSEPRLLLAE